MAKIMIGKYEGTIYSEEGGYTGAIDLGPGANARRRRVKRKGRTKAQVKDKLREAVADLEAGVTTDAGYTVKDAVGRPAPPRACAHPALSRTSRFSAAER
jgi:hypothetical protein